LTKTTDNLNNAKSKEYEFDALGRLTKAKGGNNLWTQTYSYDRFGNRLNVVATGNGIDGQPMQKDGIGSLTYDNSTNRVVETADGYQYDVAGNMTRGLAEDGVTWLKYEHDAANRLQVIKKASDNSYVEAFQFGSSTNQRLMKTDYLVNQTTIYAGDVEYTEYVSAIMTWTKSYVRLGDSILSTITPNGSGGETTEFNHPDRLGTRIVTNQTAGTSTEQASLPFGTALGSETSRSESKRFTSYDRSVRTGLDYAINRTYDSKLGRFTQVDPIKMASSNPAHPQTLNLYSYCGNDPINHTDPNGLFFGFFKKLAKWIIAALAVAAAIYLIVNFNIVGLGFSKALLAILGLVAGVSSAAATVLWAAGYVDASKVLSFISRLATGFGNVLSQQGQIKRTPGIFGLDGKPASLGPKYSKLYKTSKDILLALLKDPTSACYKFLVKSGFDPKKIVDNIEKRTPYDALKSTNDAKDFGFSGQSVKDFFNMLKNGTKPKVHARGGTSNAGDIYYTRSGLNIQTILHENIHSTFESATALWNVYDPSNKASDPMTGVRNVGKGRILDSEVQTKLGIPVDPNTTTIDDKLKLEGCK
jgi:RHS repeat-associated protein